MIKTTIIKSDKQLAAYASEYALQAQNSVDINYLKNAKVRLFYQEKEENLLAGFCIYSGPDNYRTFLPLSPIQLNELTKKYRFDVKPPHELSCLWIHPSLRASALVIYFYFFMLFDLLRLPNHPTIFGTHAKGIKNFFILGFPEVIFKQRLFVKTKGKECDFWILKGSKFRFLYGLIVLYTIRVLFGKKSLSRFRDWLGKDK